MLVLGLTTQIQCAALVMCLFAVTDNGFEQSKVSYVCSLPTFKRRIITFGNSDTNFDKV